MSYFYFFKKDGQCKWMIKEEKENYPKYLTKPVDYNGEKIKFYAIANWVLRDNKGANLEWANELKLNYVQSINDLPEGAGIYITGYDSDIEEYNYIKKKGIPLIDNPCPWIRELRNQLLNVNIKTHQIILMIIKGHMVYDCFKTVFPDDIIIIEPHNFKEEITKKKNNKPVHLLVYAAFRQKDVEKVINFINLNYPNKNNNLDGYKKTLCMWTKQGLFEEIEEKVIEKKLDEIWIICSSERDTSTTSIIREVNDNDVKPVIIKNETDIPKSINDNLNIGVLIAGIPLSTRVKNFINIIKKRFLTDKEF